MFFCDAAVSVNALRFNMTQIELLYHNLLQCNFLKISSSNFLDEKFLFKYVPEAVWQMSMLD